MNVTAGYSITISLLFFICIVGLYIREIPYFCKLCWRSSGQNRVCGNTLNIIELLILLTYITANGLWLWFGGRSELVIRSATLAKVNMVPLFLGGRTSAICDFLGIRLSTYQLFHTWIGLAVVFQGILHAGMALSQPKMQTQAILGSILLFILCLAFVSSLFCLRRRGYEPVLLVHFILAVTTLVITLCHMRISRITLLYPLLGLVVWLLNFGFRLYRIASYSRSATYTTKRQDNIERITITITRQLKAQPGQYFYIYFRGLQFLQKFQAFQLVVVECRSNDTSTELDFVVENSRGIFGRPNGKNLVVDGPWGPILRHQLDRYNRFILLGEGVGVAALLSCTSYLHNKSSYPLDSQNLHKTLDLYWRPGGTEESRWVKEVGKELKESHNVGYMIRAFCDLTQEVPKKNTKEKDTKEKDTKEKDTKEKDTKEKDTKEDPKPVEWIDYFPPYDFWYTLEGSNSRRDNLARILSFKDQSEDMPNEQRLVLACGSVQFLQEICSIIGQAQNNYNTRLIELELQPRVEDIITRGPWLKPASDLRQPVIGGSIPNHEDPDYEGADTAVPSPKIRKPKIDEFHSIPRDVGLDTEVYNINQYSTSSVYLPEPEKGT